LLADKIIKIKIIMTSLGGVSLEMSNKKVPKLLKKNYSIEERNTKALTLLSALTGKDLSQLVNDALGLLIEKYQPVYPQINLLKVKKIKKLDSNARITIHMEMSRKSSINKK
jgi:hypothetical protein